MSRERQPPPARRGPGLGATLACIAMLAVTASCAGTASTAAGSRAGLALPTSVPTPIPTPSRVPGPTATPTPTPTPVPSIWPTWVEPFAELIEAVRGPFTGVAPMIDFVDADAMAAELEGSVPVAASLNDAALAAIERLDDFERALGLTTADYDLLEVSGQGARAVRGVFQADRNRLLLRTHDGGPPVELPLDAQEVVVHELTHAWQRGERLEELVALGRVDPVLSRALIEGEAEWVTELWRRGLDADERTELAGTRLAAGIDPGLAAAPSIVVAGFRSPYEIGRRLYEAVALLEGAEAVDRRIGGSVLPSSVDVLDPFGWLGGDTGPPILLPAPGAPPDTVTLAPLREPLGPLNWYLVLATAVPPDTALQAARALRSTSSPSTWIDVAGTTCVAIDIAASPGAGSVVDEAFRSWAARDPVHRSFAPTDPDMAQATACDPSAESAITPLVDPLDALRILARVLDAEIWARAALADHTIGRCRAFVLLDSGESDRLDDGAWLAALAAIDPPECRL